MTTPRTQTVLDLVEEHFADESTNSPTSLIEGFGCLRLHLYRLECQLAKPQSAQDAELIFEELIQLSKTSVSIAAVHVLPALEKEDA